MATARYWHTATALPNGRVLVTAGGGVSSALATSEIWSPTTNLISDPAVGFADQTLAFDYAHATRRSTRIARLVVQGVPSGSTVSAVTRLTIRAAKKPKVS